MLTLLTANQSLHSFFGPTTDKVPLTYDKRQDIPYMDYRTSFNYFGRKNIPFINHYYMSNCGRFWELFLSYLVVMSTL